MLVRSKKNNETKDEIDRVGRISTHANRGCENLGYKCNLRPNRPGEVCACKYDTGIDLTQNLTT